MNELCVCIAIFSYKTNVILSFHWDDAIVLRRKSVSGVVSIASHFIHDVHDAAVEKVVQICTNAFLPINIFMNSVNKGEGQYRTVPSGSTDCRFHCGEEIASARYRSVSVLQLIANFEMFIFMLLTWYWFYPQRMNWQYEFHLVFQKP